jgi:heptosyltransferase-1
LRILIVKLSSLGDVVHAMPALQDIRQAFPNAQIDWVVERGFAPLVRRCAGVNRVIECDLRRWRKALFAHETRKEWNEFKHSLRSQSYDAVIDLQGLSKSALVSWLAKLGPGGQRFALANQTEGSGYEAPTRWVADQAFRIEPHTHALQRSRILCAQSLGYSLPAEFSFGLQANAKPEAAAPFALSASGRPCVALVHGSSRADKQWPQANWLALTQQLDAAGYDVALLHGTDAEQQASEALARHMPNAQVWPRLALDQLVDALAQCAGVIGVDSGLSHIAVGLNLPHVQLYNFDTAWRTGPLATQRQRSVYAHPTPDVAAVWQAWCAVSQDRL